MAEILLSPESLKVKSQMYLICFTHSKWCCLHPLTFVTNDILALAKESDALTNFVGVAKLLHA